MKTNQVREMSDIDLKTALKDNFDALENFRFRHAIGQLENYKSLSNTKKDIARILTILRERDLKINLNLKKEVVKTAKKTVKKEAKKADTGEEVKAEAKDEKKTVKKATKKAAKEEDKETNQE